MFPDSTTSITIKQLQFLSVELDFFLLMKQDQYFCGSIEASALCCEVFWHQLFKAKSLQTMLSLKASYRNQFTDKCSATCQWTKLDRFVSFQANNIVHYKVDCEPFSVKKSAELGDEREVKLKGISGSESVFYKTVSSQHVWLVLLLLTFSSIF